MHFYRIRATLDDIAMPSILELIPCNDVRRFSAGEVIIEQDGRTNLLWFLVEGAVEVVKDGVRVATDTQPGASCLSV